MGCAVPMLPDASVRAFRNAANHVRLVIPSSKSSSLTGASLDALHVDCHSLAQADSTPAPGNFDDKAWLEATYTQDGKTIYALASNEWSGSRYPSLVSSLNCRGSNNPACTLYAITEFVSTDGGAHFFYPQGDHLVAALPFRFDPSPDRNSSTGVATVSNMIEHDGYVYAYVGIDGVGSWKSGSCLIRSDDLSRVQDWRGWDGTGFNVIFGNPYGANPPSAAPACVPVIDEQLRAIQFLPSDDVYMGIVRGWGMDDFGATDTRLLLCDDTRPHSLE